MIHRTLVAALLIATAAPAAYAADPCGGLVLEDGAVRLGRSLGAGGVLSPDDVACVKAVGERLVARGGVRSVTVAARVGDAARVDGSGQKLAASAGANLGNAGIPAARITMIVPPLPPGDKAGVSIAFTESRAARPVAMVLGVTGAVEAVDGERRRAISAGDRLMAGKVVETGAGASAVLALADGSRLRLESATQVAMGRLTVDAKMARTVQLDVRRGEVTAEAAKTGGVFEIATRAGVAGVRGTQFRVAGGEGESPSRVETLEGKVNLGNTVGNVDIDAAMGSQVVVNTAPEPPRALPDAPTVKRPLQGALKDGVLAWKGVSGASGWRLETSRDAEFTLDVRTATGAAGVRHSPELEEGRWFWRVAAVDGDGFTGLWSRVYAFDVAAVDAAGG